MIPISNEIARINFFILVQLITNFNSFSQKNNKDEQLRVEFLILQIKEAFLFFVKLSATNLLKYNL
jgi:hypothetical protein